MQSSREQPVELLLYVVI